MKNSDKLSVSGRYLLTYIRYKTNNNHLFYMGNEAIAKVINCKTSSTKVLVNKLIREGYLIKAYDTRNRRLLSLSGKDFTPLDGVNMSNVEKSLLKQDATNQEQWSAYREKELKIANEKIKSLEVERDNLQNTLKLLMNALEARGITYERLEEMLRYSN